jgi:hypothetical protein
MKRLHTRSLSIPDILNTQERTNEGDIMTTINDLITAGYPTDVPLVVRRHDDADIAYDVISTKRNADGPGDPALIVLDIDDAYVVLADEDENEDEDESVTNLQPEPLVPFQIPMRSSNGENRWTAFPANRWGAGFATAEDAVHAAELVQEADAEVSRLGQTWTVRRIYRQVDELSRKGGLS